MDPVTTIAVICIGWGVWKMVVKPYIDLPKKTNPEDLRVGFPDSPVKDEPSEVDIWERYADYFKGEPKPVSDTMTLEQLQHWSEGDDELFARMFPLTLPPDVRDRFGNVFTDDEEIEVVPSE